METSLFIRSGNVQVKKNTSFPLEYLIIRFNVLCNQVQTEVHVGSVTLDTDWSETALTYITDGYSNLEASGQRPYLSNCSRRGVQRQFS